MHMHRVTPAVPLNTGRAVRLRPSYRRLAEVTLVLGVVAASEALAVHLAGQGPRELASPGVVSTVGPRADISCPAGAINISPGTNIQIFVNTYPSDTVFCLKSGVHPITRAIVPKTGNTFVGEYGTILNGTGWTTSDPNQGAFLSHNQDIDDVTIRNLVIRNMPQRGIHAYHWASDRWTIEYNELTSSRTGVAAPSNSIVRNNYIHHNVAGGYSVYRSVNTVFESNEIAYNGGEQKVVGTTNFTFRKNFVHHNTGDGIWYDADNTGALIEGNVVDDNGRDGISYEISGQGVIRNNIVWRSGSSGIFISTSKDVEIYGNRLEDNYRGIQYFVNCSAVGGGAIGWDLANTNSHDNTVKVGTRSGSLANMLSAFGCTSTQLTPYLNGSKNLIFQRSSYFVPSVTTRYWMWGLSNFQSFSDWQALGLDRTGVLSR